MLLDETLGIADRAQRAAAARAFLPKFIRAIARKKEPFAQHLREEIAMLLRKDAASLFHDHMEEHNDAVYFHEFVAHAKSHSLQFVAEGEPANMLTTDLEPDVRQAVAKMEALDREQYLDYVRCQSFRRSILCHASSTVKHEFTAEPFRRLYVASAIMPQGPRDDTVQATETFQSHRGFRISTANALVRRVLHEAAQRTPERIAFGELIDHAIDSVGNLPLKREAFEMNLARLLAEGFALRGFDLATRPADFAVRPSERPTARHLARLQAARSDNVVNLRHERVQLDALRRRLIQLLDGSRDPVQLAAAFAGAIPPNEAPTWLNRALRAFAIEALLIA
jgi:methyltransferase-like protein